jgi:hypothetical protein
MDDHFFSRHVQSLLDGTFDNDPAILIHLKREIRRQLTKIGQWNLSPSYLGFDGDSWENSEALDELSQEVYIHCIQKRLKKLAEHLSVTGSCEGSVRKKISWFLQDRQEKGNPIARRVYRNLRSASESLVEQGNAESTDRGKLTAKTIIFAIGQSVQATTDELAEFLAGQLGDREFTKLLSRNCPASWRMLETAILGCFNHGLRGYQIGELAKILADACKRPDRVGDSEVDGEENVGNIWNSISEIRTDVRQGRYLNTSDVDDRDQFAAVLRDLMAQAETNISKDRIKVRVLRTIEKIAEMIREGHDIRELSVRKLAEMLGVAKSTVAEDMARLQIPQRLHDAQTGETES